ncbi:MAG TPA: glycine betaine ABC transporter substrate-binding protein [Jiangellaceae bacterium]|nr:glycine betaine ABC transporter substrate-binding protein [Jiangellaceae bacterium]
MRIANRRTVQTLALLAGASMVITACGDDGGGGGGGDGELSGASITVGSKEFNEQLLLGQIAIQALENAGASVSDQTGIQGTANTRAALEAGEIDMYWEYTGTGWGEILGNEIADAPSDTQELAQQVADQDAENNIAWLLPPAEANNTYAIAAHSSTAEDLGISTLSEYAELVNQDPAQGSLCAAAEFLDRADGWPGVEEAYGFTLPQEQITEMDLNLVYARVTEADPCNFSEVFATDGRIPGNDLVIIEDDQNVFVAYNTTMTVRQEVLDENPAIEEIFAPIIEALTNEKMLELNERVDVMAEPPEQVAEDFLEEEGLLE